MHFARKDKLKKVKLPIFAGVRGPEIVRSLVEIEATFEKNLNILKNVKHIILDVKVSEKPSQHILYVFNPCLFQFTTKEPGKEHVNRYDSVYQS